MAKFRKNNFFASHNRKDNTVKLHPFLISGLKKIANQEKKSVSWLVETALADYFGVEVMLRKLKGKPKPARNMRDNMRMVKARKKIA